ncbi:hypothetical protein OSTOST_14079, partial [Ostertagia ostertagi]
VTKFPIIHQVSRLGKVVVQTDTFRAHLALINFLKGMIGPGCFSLPLAFRQAGLWTGFALVFFIGLLTCICMAKIVRCSQFLSSRYVLYWFTENVSDIVYVHNSS